MAVASKKKKIFDGRYEVLAIVGRGAASVVYHARHAMTHSSEVALKVLLNQKGGTPSTDRLRKEALAMVSSRHKYVVRLDDFHSVQDLCYLSMEYAREGDLRKFVTKREGVLTPEEAELFFQQSAEGLNFVHRVGITHRDIKPDNILVMNEREIRLADFGVAVLPGELASLEELRQGVGTMSYMAPEVLEGKACDKLSDIYALGVSFYEMITGVHPFENAPLIKQLEIREDKNIAPILELAPKISNKLGGVIMRCMSYDPSHRFQSMAELVKALGNGTSESDKTKPAKQITPPSRIVKPDKSKIAPSSKSAIRPSIQNRPLQDRPRPFNERHSQGKNPPNVKSQPHRVSQKPHSAAQLAKPKIDQPPPFDQSPFDIDDQSEDLDFDQITPILEAKPSKQLTPTPPISESKNSPVEEKIIEVNEKSPVLQRDDISDNVEHPDVEHPDSEIQTDAKSSQYEANDVAPNYQMAETFEEAIQEKPRRKLERRDKPIRDKPGISRNKSRPLTSWIPTIITVLLVAYAGKYILSKLANLSIFNTSRNTESSPSYSNTFIPSVNDPIESFPNLPAGMYTGSISGVTPSTSHPLTIISFPQNKSLAFIVGMEGWTPNVISLEKVEKQSNKDTLKKIRIASNGLVLDIVGEVQDGKIKGSFLNAISGENGKWSVTPITQDKGAR